MLTSSTTSRRTSAWAPDRTRPLCPWPKVARYKGSGDIERAGSFSNAARSDVEPHPLRERQVA